jgi:hypothetical protein
VLTHKENGANKNNSYMWVYCNREHGIYYFDYQKNRKGEHALEMLKDFKGHIHADAYSGYDQVYEQGVRTEVGCWAHARRKFHDVVKVEKKHVLANQALETIAKLYKVEADIKKYNDKNKVKMSAEKIVKLRQESIKVLKKFKIWLEELKSKVIPNMLLGKAITYSLNQWEALNEYTKYGHLSIDNNFAENAIRPFALGRKNWLFHGNHEGARSGALFYSLLQGAIANSLNVNSYMTYLFDNILKINKTKKFAEELPHNIAKTNPELLKKPDK